MILDTSALLVVLFDEPDADYFERAIASAATCRMSAANHLEAAMVVESRMGHEGGRQLDDFVEAAEIELVAVTPEQGLGAPHVEIVERLVQHHVVGVLADGHGDERSLPLTA